MGFIHKPQRVWVRRALFQVHLWIGIVLGFYIIVIGLTGSILVFKDELAKLNYPRLLKSDHPTTTSLTTVMDNARQAFPNYRLESAYAPGVFGDTFFAYMDEGEKFLYVFADPSDGHILGSIDLKTNWLFWISELHIRLLAGQTGYILNGIGAIFLLVLCTSGLVLWWPGVRTWGRALKVNFRRSWKRINFDLHSAVGFWLLIPVIIWALSGVYFVWPRQLENFVDRFSTVKAAQEPVVTVPPPVEGRTADVKLMLAQAERVSTGSLAGIFLPADRKRPISVYLTRGGRNNFSAADHVYFDPSSGKQLAIWHSGINPSLGSKFIYWLGPIHFGVYWGLTIKILWAAFGLSLPLLTVTGALMYWNRSLSKYGKRITANRTLAAKRRKVAAQGVSPG